MVPLKSLEVSYCSINGNIGKTFGHPNFLYNLFLMRDNCYSLEKFNGYFIRDNKGESLGENLHSSIKKTKCMKPVILYLPDSIGGLHGWRENRFITPDEDKSTEP